MTCEADTAGREVVHHLAEELVEDRAVQRGGQDRPERHWVPALLRDLRREIVSAWGRWLPLGARGGG